MEQQGNFLKLIHELIRCTDSGAKYMFVVCVKEDGDALFTIAGDYDPYQVAGFVTSRVNNMIAQYEGKAKDDGDREEMIYD